MKTSVGFSGFSFTAPTFTEIGELVVTMESESVVLNVPVIPPFVEWRLNVFAIAPCEGLAVARINMMNNYLDFDVAVCCL